MEIYKKTLYITIKKACLFRKKDVLYVKFEETIYQVPFINIEKIIVFSPSEISLNLLKYCYSKKINLIVFSHTNKIEFIIENKINSSGLINQVKCFTDSSRVLIYSKDLVKRRIKSLKKVLDDFRKNNRGKVFEPIDKIRKELKEILDNIHDIDNLQSLRGLEGTATRKYFSCFDDMILNQREEFEFKKRTKRPPKDEINVLLSLFYTVLTNFISDIILSLGYESSIGFYHKLKKGRDSLACDCVESLRTIVDKFVLFLI